MNPEELREVCAWAERRDEVLYRWVRHMILLATGSLSLLVALQSHHPDPGPALVFLRSAWISLGLCILLGSVVSYKEVWTRKALVKGLVEQRTRTPSPSYDAKWPQTHFPSSALVLWNSRIMLLPGPGFIGRLPRGLCPRTDVMAVITPPSGHPARCRSRSWCCGSSSGCGFRVPRHPLDGPKPSCAETR